MFCRLINQQTSRLPLFYFCEHFKPERVLTGKPRRIVYFCSLVKTTVQWVSLLVRKVPNKYINKEPVGIIKTRRIVSVVLITIRSYFHFATHYKTTIFARKTKNGSMSRSNFRLCCIESNRYQYPVDSRFCFAAQKYWSGP